MPLIVPLQVEPQQIVTTDLSGQYTTIYLRTKTIGQGPAVTNLFCDVYINSGLIVGGVICQNDNLIVRDRYRGFIGDLAFWDTLAGDDPDWTGLGDRFILVYLTPSDFK